MGKFHTEAFKTPEERAAAAALPIQHRQELIKMLLYKYPVFNAGVDFIKNFHRPVAGGSHDTGNIGGLLGESRTGKTVMCKYYASQYAAGVGDGAETYPIVYLEATEQMTPTQMAEQLFHLTGARSVPKIKTASLLSNSILRLAAGKTELIIIDDAQFLFFDRNKTQIASFRGFVKQLADAGLFNILLVGEERLHIFIHEVAALANRGGFMSETVKPMGDGEVEFEMFRLLLDKIDDRLPFAADSGLNNPLWARDFHHYSGGKIGRLMNLVRRAALIALNEGTACVMVEHLREAANRLRGPYDRYPYFEKS